MDRVFIEGVPVDPLTLPELLDRVAAGVHQRAPTLVSYVNVHVLNEAHRDPELRAFLQGCDVVYCDGNGPRLAARLLGHRLPERMTGADWIHPLCRRAAEEGWRLAWIGGEPGVTAAAAEVLERATPGLRFVATEHGFHRGAEEEAMVERVREARPDIVLVGMGTPIQERWAARWREALGAPVIWCLGATADFISGKVDRGPEFLYADHEWLARLLADPRRLWRRFLVGNPLFFARILRERARR